MGSVPVGSVGSVIADVGPVGSGIAARSIVAGIVTAGTVAVRTVASTATAAGVATTEESVMDAVGSRDVAAAVASFVNWTAETIVPVTSGDRPIRSSALIMSSDIGRAAAGSLAGVATNLRSSVTNVAVLTIGD